MSYELLCHLLRGKNPCRFLGKGRDRTLLFSIRADEFTKDQVNEGINGLAAQQLSLRRHGGSGNAFFYTFDNPFVGNPSEEVGILPEGPGKVCQVELDQSKAIGLRCMASLTERHVEVLRIHSMKVILRTLLL